MSNVFLGVCQVNMLNDSFLFSLSNLLDGGHQECFRDSFSCKLNHNVKVLKIHLHFLNELWFVLVFNLEGFGHRHCFYLFWERFIVRWGFLLRLIDFRLPDVNE